MWWSVKLTLYYYNRNTTACDQVYLVPISCMPQSHPTQRFQGLVPVRVNNPGPQTYLHTHTAQMSLIAVYYW